jgi:hypothetical protein
VEHLIQEDSLERFAAGTASRDEARAITRHLLRECPICARHLRDLLRPSVQGADYGPVLDGVVRACLGRPKEQDVLAASVASVVPAARASRKWPLPVSFH